MCWEHEELVQVMDQFGKRYCWSSRATPCPYEHRSSESVPIRVDGTVYELSRCCDSRAKEKAELVTGELVNI